MYINMDEINPHFEKFSDFWLNLQGIDNVQYQWYVKPHWGGEGRDQSVAMCL